jgi:phosphate transport system substrate-binding protein
VKRSLSCVCVLSLLLAAQAARADEEVIGAGGTFPAPLIEAAAAQYSKDSTVRLLYRAVGSGEGIRRVTARSADFAMTDVPLTRAELEQDDLMQFPVIAGAVVPVVNLPGIADGELKLNGAVLADIYLGRITYWNAPELKALNPQLALPDLPIQVLHRAEGSGTSFVFTYYLSLVSAEWRDRLGIGSRLHWPVGAAEQGNEGMAQAVQDTAGAIAYVEYIYAVQHKLAGVQLLNRAGRYVRVGEAGVRAALASAQWSRAGYYEVLANRGGEDSWPIVGVSFALVHQRQEDSADALATLGFLHWIYAHPELAGRLHYVPLDAGLVGRIESSWSRIHDEQGQALWNGRP